VKRPKYDLPLSALEEAQLRKLVYRAFALRNGDPDEYRRALEAIESWHVETLPDRIARFEAGRT
jgi:hypothetical protein